MITARIVNIIHSFVDYPTPEDSSITIFLSGCIHKCPDCHNKHLQDESMGEPSTAQELYNDLKELSKKYNTNKIVFQGGDPLYADNSAFLRDFIYINKEYEVCVYTGYSIDIVKAIFKKGDIKYWKCGLYNSKKHRTSGKTDNEFTLASSNQNFYDTNFKKISKDGILSFKRRGLLEWLHIMNY